MVLVLDSMLIIKINLFQRLNMAQIFYKAQQGEDVFRGYLELDSASTETIQQALDTKYTTSTNVVHYHLVGIDCDCGEF